MFKTFALPAIGLIVLFLLVTGYRLVRLQLSVASNRKFWEKQNIQMPAANDFIYVALGDSTAQGIGASNPLKGYVGIIADYVHEKTGRNVHIINLSVSGARLQDLLDTQLEQLKDIPKIDLLTIEIGANDVPALNEKAFTDKFSELVSRLPKGSVIADIPSFKGGLKAKLRDTSSRAAALADKSIASRSDVYPVHLFSRTDKQGLSDFAADLFHLNNKGYQNWAEAFIDAIESAHLL